jgi:NAD(P)-dependent dehydrogenase (short-subunit alcohol dehydrogenase family)
MGQPEDLMGAVTFLSSDASAYITGTSFAFHFAKIGDFWRTKTDNKFKNRGRSTSRRR